MTGIDWDDLDPEWVIELASSDPDIAERLIDRDMLYELVSVAERSNSPAVLRVVSGYTELMVMEALAGNEACGADTLRDVYEAAVQHFGDTERADLVLQPLSKNGSCPSDILRLIAGGAGR
jgi:hypothetical protein